MYGQISNAIKEERSLGEMLDSVPLVVVLSVSGLLVIAVMVALTIAVFAWLWR
jgi:hypothetical protein